MRIFSRRMTGFSLVELIACIVIIGILAAVAGPSFFDNTPFSQRGYADEVASAIRYANNVAVATGCDVAVTLNATDYQAMQRAASGTSCATSGSFVTNVQRTDGGTLSGTAPSNVTLTPATQLVINPQGNVTSGVTQLNVGTYTLTVDAISGLVTVQ